MRATIRRLNEPGGELRTRIELEGETPEECTELAKLWAEFNDMEEPAFVARFRLESAGFDDHEQINSVALESLDDRP